MDEQNFRELIDRYLKGKATPGEIRAVEAFFEAHRKEGKDWPHDIMGNPEESEKEILAKVLDGQSTPQATRSIFLRTAWKIAATLLILIGVGYSAYVYTFRKPAALAVNAFAAGGDKAILRLADGTEIELDSAGTHAIPQQGTVSIVNENGRLSYEAKAHAENILYNTIITPRGGQYEIALADGSKVWLNSVSSLRYPTAFTGAERVVELTGEAYFEIAKDPKMPFKVQVTSSVSQGSPAEILVLGTHFNVMAYPEEETVATTLLEGSVEIMQGKITGVLKPGEQGQLTTIGTLEIIEDYDVSQAIAWKDGRFVFNDTALEDIMRQVSRWYDVEVTFQDDVRALQFGGVVSRRENASAVLDLLELTGEVDFEVKGNNIIVKARKKDQQ